MFKSRQWTKVFKKTLIYNKLTKYSGVAAVGNCVIDEDSVESHFEKLKENDCCDQSRLADKVKLVEKRIN